ncbi:anti-sigma F factor antagonist [Petroclostridium sp. X23]|uniref:anti-sigma F factor antagonist n=1 Tax=Petroclostridium sp. X23 TaxID=3045146 RepID=UPI0024AE0020|nr:anti-sigma F factor antagonist [Petroclostridium sp. X23]WHH60448.1 anti-sigma F factor antagonist [Petroclostridium sp. X23]
MQISFEIINRTLIAKIEGELDHHTSVDVRERIDREMNMKQIKNLIFDFERLSFMDSSGIGVIIGRYKHIQKLNGKICITDLNPQIDRIMTISGLRKIIPIYNNLSDALEDM